MRDKVYPLPAHHVFRASAVGDAERNRWGILRIASQWEEVFMEEVALGLPQEVPGEVPRNYSETGRSLPRGWAEKPAVTRCMKDNRGYSVKAIGVTPFQWRWKANFLKYRLMYSVVDAITKYYKLGGLNNRNSFSHSLEARSPRSRCGQVWFPLRPLSLACR